MVPKAFLPVGDSSFVWGVMIAREGSSPKEMRDLQDRADELIRQDPAVAATFTMTGNNAFLSSNQGLLLAFLKSPDNRAPIQEVAGGLMGKLGDIPGVMPFMRARPVLEISTGATNQNQGQYAFTLSGVNPKQVYVSTRLMENYRLTRGFDPLLRLLQQHAQSRHRDPARSGQDVRRIGDADTHLAQKRLLAELSLLNQKA